MRVREARAREREKEREIDRERERESERYMINVSFMHMNRLPSLDLKIKIIFAVSKLFQVQDGMSHPRVGENEQQ